MERIPLPDLTNATDSEKCAAYLARARAEVQALGRTDAPFDSSLIDWSKVEIRIAE